MPKRRKTEETVDAGGEEEDDTPRKTRRTGQKDSPTVTPSTRKSILKTNGTPSSLRRVLFSTPAQKPEVLEEEVGDEGVEDDEGEDTVTVRNDRSAKRKSARTLQQQPSQDISDDEEDVGEAALARAILDDPPQDDEEQEGIVTAVTPSKRRPGRPRKQRTRTPSPPPDLPPHELYFFQNRAGGNQTSANTLPPNLLLNHEDYLAATSAYIDPHQQDIQRLQALHSRAFDQWIFELDEQFSICLFGYGSKRELVMDFAHHLHYASAKPPTIVIINGYTPDLTPRDLLTTLASTVLPKQTKLRQQPLPLLELILASLTKRTHLFIHSLDAPPLRRHTAILARLASHPMISLLATVDTPLSPLILPAFQFIYHDTTTFVPFRAELDVVEQVHALLGKKGRRVGGKDGVMFVLRSLNENARALYRLLLIEQLHSESEGGEQMDMQNGDGSDESILGASEDEAALANNTPSRTHRGERRGRPARKQSHKAAVVRHAKVAEAVGAGVEYRALYHKAVEQFVCSSELSFRTLLKEFVDHDMVDVRRDGGGGERVGVVGLGRSEMAEVLGEIEAG